MSIRLKILVPMVLVAVFGLLFAGAATWGGSQANGETAAIAESAIHIGELARKASDDFGALAAMEKDVVSMTHFVDPEGTKARFNLVGAAITGELGEMKSAALTPQLAQASEQAAANFQSWRHDAGIVLGIEPGANPPMPEVEARKEAELRRALSRALDLAGSEARASIEEVRAKKTRIDEIAMGLGGGFLLAAVFAAWRFSLSVSRPILALAKSAQRLASGDVSETFEAASRRDEVGEIARAVAAFRDNVTAAQSAEARAAEERAAAEAARQQAEALRAANGQEQARVVEALSKGLERLAKGDLTCRVEDEFSPAYARLKTNFNASLDVLRQTLGAIAEGARDLQAGSSEIAGLATDLSNRTGAQTASIEEAAAALEEITTTVRLTADNAGQARAVVSRTRTEAEKSGAVVRTAVEAINRIQNSSQEIAKIIGVIDEIAFQTNLLALNAGVEAARAGESGRGFAVVATEVRALAQRSADASKEIRTLISASSAQVKDGVDLVVSAGSALDRIFAQVSEIDRVVETIAGGAAEQSTGLQSVNKGVSEIDRVNQSNVEIVEQTTGACAQVANRAAELAQAVAMFKVEREPELRRAA